MNQLLGIVGPVLIPVYLAAALFWGITTATVANWGGLRVGLSTFIGAIVPVLGFMVVVALAYSAKHRSANSAKMDAFLDPSDPFAAVTALDGSNPFAETEANDALASDPFSDWASSNHVNSGARTLFAAPNTRLTLAALGLVALTVAYLAGFLLPWLQVKVLGVTVVRIGAVGSGIDALLVATVIAMTAAIVLVLLAFERWAVVIVAWFATGWLLLGVLARAFESTFAAFLLSIDSIGTSITDVLAELGVDAAGIPANVDEISLSSLLGDSEVLVGSAWWLVLGLGIAGSLWAVSLTALRPSQAAN